MDEEVKADHDRALREVFDMFRRKGLTLNRSKCTFGADRIKFFGYIFSKDGMSSDPEKVAALHGASIPPTKEELFSFLGMAGFNAGFITD